MQIWRWMRQVRAISLAWNRQALAYSQKIRRRPRARRQIIITVRFNWPRLVPRLEWRTPMTCSARSPIPYRLIIPCFISSVTDKGRKSISRATVLGFPSSKWARVYRILRASLPRKPRWATLRFCLPIFLETILAMRGMVIKEIVSLSQLKDLVSIL